MGKYNWENLKKKLPQGIEKQENSYDDPREWKLQRDENNNGTAIIRLLPGKGGDTPAVVKIYEHSIKMFNSPTNKYRYYIEPSPSSIKEPCPVSEVYFELGDIGTEEAKKAQRQLSRSVKFISNILVVNDPANPDNNGKIFYWKYGVKLFEKFQAALDPTENQRKVGKKPIELFDPEDGHNIILEAKEVAGFINYDDTTFEPTPSRAFETEEEMDEAILEKCIDLTEFYDPSYYKPYAELKKKLAWVLEKTPIEAMLLEHGSKVITEPYSSTRNNTGVEKTSGSSAMENVTYKPKTRAAEPKTEPKPKTEPAAKDEAPFDVTEPDEVTVEAPKPKAKVSAADTISDDEVLAMLDDI